jgi:hypothetical protein
VVSVDDLTSAPIAALRADDHVRGEGELIVMRSATSR